MSTNETTPAQLQLDEGQASINDQKDNVMTNSADTANDPTPPACPSWCTDKPGHEYDSISNDGTEFFRFHSGPEFFILLDDYVDPQPNGNQKRPPASIQITSLEANGGGTVTITSPVISMIDATEDLTVHDCHRLINALIFANVELSRITGEAPRLVSQGTVIANVNEWLKGR